MCGMDLVPVDCAVLRGVAPAFEPAAETDELTADAARTPAAPASISRRDTVERDAFEMVLMLILRGAEKRRKLTKRMRQIRIAHRCRRHDIPKKLTSLQQRGVAHS